MGQATWNTVGRHSTWLLRLDNNSLDEEWAWISGRLEARTDRVLVGEK